MSQETFEQKFDVKEDAKLVLSNIRGSIDIRAGEPGVIEVKAVKHLNSGNQDLTQVIIEQSDNQVNVKTDYDNSPIKWFGGNKPCKVDYTVRVPTECDLKVSGVSSKIDVSGVDGIMEINSVSGGLSLSNLSGTLKFGVVSGSIQGTNIKGELDANTVSGSIRLIQSQFPSTVMKTVSGSMVVETPLGEGPYMFKGVSGNVTLIVPEETGCIARTKSVSGRLRTSLPVTKDRRYGSRGLAEIQGGGPDVTYKCVSGSLRIVKFEDEKINEPKRVVSPPTDPKNHLEILHKIESGDISVEDALEEMDA